MTAAVLAVVLREFRFSLTVSVCETKSGKICELESFVVDLLVIINRVISVLVCYYIVLVTLYVNYSDL